MSALTDKYIDDTYEGWLHSNAVALPEIGQEDIYDGAGNKSSLKLGRACNGATICGTLTVDALAMTSTDTLKAILLEALYPVNAIFIRADSTDPSTLLGGSWSLVGQGKVLGLVGTGTDINGTTLAIAAEDANTGGEYTHQLTEDEMPSHTHRISTGLVSSSDDNAGNTGFLGSSPRSLLDAGGIVNPSLSNDTTGNGLKHNNMPPVYGVYMWKRIA